MPGIGWYATTLLVLIMDDPGGMCSFANRTMSNIAMMLVCGQHSIVGQKPPGTLLCAAVAVAAIMATQKLYGGQADPKVQQPDRP